ncbi:MAG: thioredoxin family protein [Bryobacteraceae bacterium]
MPSAPVRCLLFLSCAASLLSAPLPIPHGKVELISEQSSIQPGSSFQVGLHFQLEPGWHIYWKNPGDSGQPPRVQWNLPPGLSAGPIEFPVPHRLPVGPLLDYGYENDVLLPVAIKAEKSGLPGGTVALKGNLRVLVCRETCIPGKAALELSLPVRREPAKNLAANEPLFARARASMPLPAPPAWHVSAASNPSSLVLKVQGVTGAAPILFFPAQPDIIENAAPQNSSATPQGIELKLKRPNQPSEPVSKLEGLLIVPASSNGNSPRGYEISANVSTALAPAPASAAAPQNLLLVMSLAFLGGLVLNLMPCVFPVLSIKALHLLESANKNSRVVRLSAIAYTLGVLASFWVLVGVLLALRAGGNHLGWGFQLQSPVFVAFLCCFLFLFGLSLAGMFEVGQSFMGAGSGLAQQPGYTGSFFTGVLATVVATPCTAPFMGAAVGFALSQPAVICTLVFTALAVGLAAPFLLLAFAPHLSRFLPRPGRWMETLKQFMAFPIFGTVIWLLWVFGQQSSIDQVTILLAALLVIAIAGWILNRWANSRLAIALAVAFIICAALYSMLSLSGAASASAGARGAQLSNGALHWEPFSAEKLATYRASEKPVLIDFTAAWCLTCQVNDRVVFHSKQVEDQLNKSGVALLRADWTSSDPAITEALAQYGRSGVPLYVLYAPGHLDPVILPDGLLRPSTFLDTLHQLNL